MKFLSLLGAMTGKGKFGRYLIPVLFLAACGEGSNAPDVSAIQIDLKTRRLDRDIVKIDTNQWQAGTAQVLGAYPDFLPFYVSRLLPFAVDDRSMDSVQRIGQSIAHLLTDKDLRGVFDTVEKHFPDMKRENNQLIQGFRYMKHYFPDYEIPEVVYFVSGLNNWTAITYEDRNKYLGIGLDMFLGRSYPYYASVGIPDYMTRKMAPEYMVVNAFRAIYEDLCPFTAEGRNLLDLMIQRGKQQYFLASVLPFTNDTLRLGYSKAELDWCNGNEAQVYNFFIKENLLYEANWQKILRYVNDGPSSTGMPSESPGNIGTWLGTRIVQEYMKRHPETSFADLLKLDNAQQMLMEAKYKPR